MDYLTAAAVCSIASIAMSIGAIGYLTLAAGRNRQTTKKEEKMELIELNAPMELDENGFWCNPGIPDFEEDHEAYRAWLKDQGIEIKWDMLDEEDDTHPAYISYFENGSGDIRQWSPAPPDGEGWNTLSIHDTEDGPIWVWARRTAAAPTGSAA